MENNTNASSAFIDNLDQASFVIGHYVIRILSGIGVFTNIFFLNLLSNEKLKHKFYGNLWLKTFFDLVMCIVGIEFTKSICLECTDKEFDTYLEAFYEFYLLKYALYVAQFMSIYSEIYLILNRCFTKKQLSLI